MGFDDIDISENELLRRYPQVLEALLLDHTTHRPIFWATDHYAHLGAGYQWHDSITPERITGEHGRVIQPRVLKSREQQLDRTKQMAEVFTRPGFAMRKTTSSTKPGSDVPTYSTAPTNAITAGNRRPNASFSPKARRGKTMSAPPAWKSPVAKALIS